VRIFFIPPHFVCEREGRKKAFKHICIVDDDKKYSAINKTVREGKKGN
jgi:hypothetical protein